MMLRWLRRRQEGSPAGLRRRRGAHPRPWPGSPSKPRPSAAAAPIGGRLLHHDETRSLQVLHKALGDDLRYEFIGVVDALAALKAQGERQRIGDVFGGGGGEAFGRVGHRGSIARGRKQIKEPARPFSREEAPRPIMIWPRQ